MGKTGQKTRSSASGGSETGRIRAVFLSTPLHTDTSLVRRILDEEGVKILFPEDVAEPGQFIRDSLIQGIQESDAVLVVPDPTAPSENVFYEMGLADALGKPILVISPDRPGSSMDVASQPWIRARPDNEEALRFSLVLWLRAPHHGRGRSSGHVPETRPLGNKVDAFLGEVRSWPGVSRPQLEDFVAGVIRESGVDIQASGSQVNDKQKDLADISVWSDDLTEWVGNPFPIVIHTLLTPVVARKVAKHLERVVPWILVIYFDASPEAVAELARPGILSMSIEMFLEGLRDHSFGQLILNCLNKAIHGIR